MAAIKSKTGSPIAAVATKNPKYPIDSTANPENPAKNLGKSSIIELKMAY